MQKTTSCNETDEPPSSGLIDSNPMDTVRNNSYIQYFPTFLTPQYRQYHTVTYVPDEPLIIAGNNRKRKERPALQLVPQFVVGSKTRQFRKQFYPVVTDAEWNDWHWQLRNRIKDLKGLERIITLSEDERNAISHHQGSLPFAIVPYYASLIDPDNPLQPLRRTVVTTGNEYRITAGEAEDPLGEDKHSPVPGLVHRYPDRVLFLVTGFCSVYCRYCTRSRLVGNPGGEYRFKIDQWDNAIRYIENNTAIRDVLLSGGDPLTLADDRLEWLLMRLRRIPHLEILRIGTKVPVVLPQRITPALVKMLRKYHPLWLSIHFTHPAELTPEVAQACGRLADAGIPLGSQTVLLKGVNDTVETMRLLCHGLLKNRVRPYYLYQCDPVHGSAHFRTSIRKGLEIIAGLRGFTSGYAVPTYVVDAPGGGGKIPLLPDYVVGRDGDDLVLRNYKNEIYRYPDTCDDHDTCRDLNPVTPTETL